MRRVDGRRSHHGPVKHLREGRQAPDPSARLRTVVTVLVLGAVLVGAARFLTEGVVSDELEASAAPRSSGTEPSTSRHDPTATTEEPTTSTSSTTTTALPERPADVVPDWTVGKPWGEVEGLTMFRGNPTRTWYGVGPVPEDPENLWSYPESGGLCGQSTVGGETTTWCGTGWTGQPVVWERPDGVTEVIFGAYDHSVHFLDAETGQPTRPALHTGYRLKGSVPLAPDGLPIIHHGFTDVIFVSYDHSVHYLDAETGQPTRPAFLTGDIIKGSVTLDPDGFPILYTGSRDNKLRAIALDRERPTELWALDANVVSGVWNNDWDGNPVIIDDILYEGGENSWFFAVRLNRGYDGDGLV